MENKERISMIRKCLTQGAYTTALDILSEVCEPEPVTMRTPEDVVVYAQEKLGHKRREHVLVAYLDNASKPMESEIISIGTNNTAIVHPAEVFRKAIVLGAAHVLVIHNHPSGTLKASEEDIELSKRLTKAGQILGIKLLDFLIVTRKGFSSFAEEGILRRFE